MTLYLENINLILAFIIDIISQPNELLNISSANTEKHVLLFNTIYIYVYIYRYNALLATMISCLRGSVGRTREYCTLIFLSSALLVRIPYATFIIVAFEKTICCFIFIKFSPFAISFLYFN